MVRRRVPESDAEDIVQASLAEAFTAGKRDEEPDGLRRWVWGVARHKVVDHFRRRRRMADELPEMADDARPYDELDLLRWAKRELPKGENAEETLHWMLREADGETLETIAEESNVPAPRVRKRVSRLREYFRERWSGQAAALVALGVIAIVVLVMALRRRSDDIAKDLPKPIPSAKEPTPHELAEEKRREAFERCEEGSFRPCLDLLDEAKGIDPKGDEAEAVRRARKAATDALTPAPLEVDGPTKKGDMPKKLAPDPTAAPSANIPVPTSKPTPVVPTPKNATPSPLSTEPPPQGKKAPQKPMGKSITSEMSSK